jgi:tetratricopeptide (TPR) repeat protein
MREALSIPEKAFGADHPRYAARLNGLAVALRNAHRYDEAVAYSRRALALYQAKFGPDHVFTSTALTGMGASLSELHRASEARPLFEKALSLQERGTVEPWQLAQTRFKLARALWASHRDPARARRLAEAARATLAAQPEMDPDALKEVEAALVQHR